MPENSAPGRAPAWRTFTPIALTPILSAARDAFYENGFHGTSVRDIAGRVGVTVPALYYHHPNKEAILLALLTLSTEDIAWRVDAAAADAGNDPVAALSNVGEAVLLHMTGLEKIPALDVEARYLSEEHRPSYAEPRRQIEEIVTEVVARGVATGEFTATDPRELARALLGMWQSVPRWYRPDGPTPRAQLIRAYVEISLQAAGHRRP